MNLQELPGSIATGLGSRPIYHLLSADRARARRSAEWISLNQVAAYYDAKTSAIIKRYGPGPRIHYHTGLIDELPALAVPSGELRRELIGSQERILEYAASVWRAASHLSGEVLDVGCGLGGGSIFWAQQFGAQVTALTCAASHAPLIRGFAAQAGVAGRVQPLVCDAHEIPGENRFNAAVAIDSSCHLERRAWMRRVAGVLRPGGRLFILDCFLGRPECAGAFDQHWRTRIGAVAEYLDAASAAGLKLSLIQDLSSRTQHFWTLTSALIEAEARENHPASLSKAETMRRDESLRAHRFMQRHLGDQGLQYALLSFVKA